MAKRMQVDSGDNVFIESSVFTQTEHGIRIMNGSRLNPIIKINGMLSANDENAGKEYGDALEEFLEETCDKIIPDIVFAALGNDHIIAMIKYSSSRDVPEGHLKDHKDVKLDGFLLFGVKRKRDTASMPVGQSEDENRV